MSINLQRQALEQTAKNVVSLMDISLENAKDQVESLAALPLMADALSGSTERADKYFQDYIANSNSLQSVILTDSSGKPVAGCIRGGEKLADTYADRDYFKAIAGGQKGYLNKTVLRAKSTGALVLVAAQAVNGPDGKPRGMVFVSAVWDGFTKKYFDPIRFGKTGYGFIFDTGGVLLAHAVDKSLLLAPAANTGIQRGTAATEGMVEQAAEAVSQATELAGRSGESLKEIVSVVEAAGDQVRSIATAAEQQSATSEEINRAVDAIHRIARETAQVMDESARAVTELAARAQDLNALVEDIRGGSRDALAR